MDVKKAHIPGGLLVQGDTEAIPIGYLSDTSFQTSRCLWPS